MFRTKIVGICNVTPDSFSDGGQYYDPEKAVARVLELFDQGADLVDIGAESTRPGAIPIGPDEEWLRLEPVLNDLAAQGVMEDISLDTMKPIIAERFIKLGGAVINDVSGLRDPAMVKLIAHHRGVQCVVGHLPKESPTEAHKARNSSLEPWQIVLYLRMRLRSLIGSGLLDSQIIVDPGIGFGKRPWLNYQLLSFAYSMQENPVMIGYSNKNFLDTVGITNLDAGRIAIESGVAYLRVHDVVGHVALRDRLMS